MKRIDVLPDDVLLDIFDFYLKTYSPLKTATEKWQSLVHVCRRWRSLVLGSPRRLNLRLCCMVATATRKTLDVWPALPLIIMDDDINDTPVDNLISVLEHSDRICQINLFCFFRTTSQIEKVGAAIQVPFLELTALRLESQHSPSETTPVVPDSFLGKSALRLRLLTFVSIPFPGLKNLLLSTTHLVELHLSGVSHSGYISPATCLSVLTSLE